MKFLLTDDASQYCRLFEVETVRGIGQEMFANFRTLIKFVFVDSAIKFRRVCPMYFDPHMHVKFVEYT